MNSDKMKIDPAVSEFCEANNAAVVEALAERLGCSEQAARILAESWEEWRRPLYDAAWNGRGEMKIEVEDLQKIIGRKIDEASGKGKESMPYYLEVRKVKESLQPPETVLKVPVKPDVEFVITPNGNLHYGPHLVNPPYRIVFFSGSESRAFETKELSPIKAEKVLSLKFGPHTIYWREGGSSLAMVGALHDGRRWFAPANWTGSHLEGIASSDWSKVHDAVEYGAWSSVSLSDG